MEADQIDTLKISFVGNYKHKDLGDGWDQLEYYRCQISTVLEGVEAIMHSIEESMKKQGEFMIENEYLNKVDMDFLLSHIDILRQTRKHLLDTVNIVIPQA